MERIEDTINIINAQFYSLRSMVYAAQIQLSEIYSDIRANNRETQQKLGRLLELAEYMARSNGKNVLELTAQAANNFRDSQNRVCGLGNEICYEMKRHPAFYYQTDASGAITDSDYHPDVFNFSRTFFELSEAACQGSIDDNVIGPTKKQSLQMAADRAQEAKKTDDNSVGREFGCYDYFYALNPETTTKALEDRALNKYVDIFSYIRGLSGITSATKFELEAPYAFLPLFEDAAGRWLTLYGYVGSNYDPSVTKLQISNMISIAGKNIDTFFRNTRERDFIDVLISAYKKTSDKILQIINEFTVTKNDARNSKFLADHLSRGRQILQAPIISASGCVGLEYNLIEYLANNPTLQSVASINYEASDDGNFKVKPTVSIFADRITNDHESNGITRDKYTLRFRLNMGTAWGLNDEISQEFYLYSEGLPDSACAIVNKMIWGENGKKYVDAIQKKYGDIVKKDAGEYPKAQNALRSWENYSPKDEACKYFREEVHHNPDLDCRYLQGVGRAPENGSPEAIAEAARYNQEDQLRKNAWDAKVAENQKIKNSSLEIAKDNLAIVTKGKNILEVFLGIQKTTRSGYNGGKGVYSAFITKINEYLNVHKDQIDQYIERVKSAERSILTKIVVENTGIQADICELELVRTFMEKIIDLSYRNTPLGSEKFATETFGALLNGAEITDALINWKNSQPTDTTDYFSGTRNKAVNINEVSNMMRDAEGQFNVIPFAEQSHTLTGHPQYDGVMFALKAIHSPERVFASGANEALYIDMPSYFDTYRNAKTAEEKFASMYDVTNKSRKMSLDSLDYILTRELNDDNRILVEDLSFYLLTGTDKINDLDLGKLGIEYLAKCAQHNQPNGEPEYSPKKARSIFYSQTVKELKIDIINTLFSLNEPFIKLSLEILFDPNEDLSVRWAALSHLSQKSENIISLTKEVVIDDSYKSYKKYYSEKVLDELFNIGYSDYLLAMDVIEGFTRLSPLTDSSLCFTHYPNFYFSISAQLGGEPGVSSDALFVTALKFAKESNMDKDKLKELQEYDSRLSGLFESGMDLVEFVKNNPDFYNSLHNMSTLDISEDLWGIEHFRDNVDKLVKLKRLYIHTKITTLPENFANLRELEELGISNACFSKIPDLIFELRNLKVLRLDRMDGWLCDKVDGSGSDRGTVDFIPETIANLTKLEVLELNDLGLKKLPDAIGSLPNLTKLNVYKNELEYLPEFHGRTIEGVPFDYKIEELSVSSNNLEKLPSTVGNLKELKTLSAGDNKIREIPETIKNLSELTHLTLRNNDIKIIPDEICSLKKLEYLDFLSASEFYRNESSSSHTVHNFTNIPDCIGELSELVIFFITGEEISSIPTSIKMLKKLRNLSISSKKLTELPDEIGDLKSLKGLSISGNENLSYIPKSIGKLGKLESLSLDDNNIISENLPDVFGRLVNLRYLDLQRNKLTSIPVSIGTLRKLGWLDLSNNNIGNENLPDIFSRLENLWRLELGGNRLTSIPASIEKLRKLSFLDLSRNNISSENLPESIDGFASLQSLYLSQNQLSSFPNFICDLKTLEHLNLSGNKIELLPPPDSDCIKGLTELNYFSAEDNPLAQIPDYKESMPELSFRYSIPKQVENISNEHEEGAKENGDSVEEISAEQNDSSMLPVSNEHEEVAQEEEDSVEEIRIVHPEIRPLSPVSMVKKPKLEELGGFPGQPMMLLPPGNDRDFIDTLKRQRLLDN